MSDQYYWKKEAEHAELVAFLEEFSLVVGSELTLVASGERPDFTVSDTGGNTSGLEVVRVFASPQSRHWRRVFDGVEHMDALDTAIRLQETVYRKDEASAARVGPSGADDFARRPLRRAA